MDKFEQEENQIIEDEILQMAKEIGYAIQRDRRYLMFIESKENNDNDEELQRLIGDFSIVRSKLNSETVKKERDNSKINELDREVTEMYEKIMGNKNMREYSLAKAQIDDIVRMTATIIEQSANGSDPETVLNSGCSKSDCAGCSGC